eukprot:jgi/Chrzof1/9870/Cz04g19040.t1
MCGTDGIEQAGIATKQTLLRRLNAVCNSRGATAAAESDSCDYDSDCDISSIAEDAANIVTGCNAHILSKGDDCSDKQSFYSMSSQSSYTHDLDEEEDVQAAIDAALSWKPSWQDTLWDLSSSAASETESVPEIGPEIGAESVPDIRSPPAAQPQTVVSDSHGQQETRSTLHTAPQQPLRSVKVRPVPPVWHPGSRNCAGGPLGLQPRCITSTPSHVSQVGPLGYPHVYGIIDTSLPDRSCASHGSCSLQATAAATQPQQEVSLPAAAHQRHHRDAAACRWSGRVGVHDHVIGDVLAEGGPLGAHAK